MKHMGEAGGTPPTSSWAHYRAFGDAPHTAMGHHARCMDVVILALGGTGKNVIVPYMRLIHNRVRPVADVQLMAARASAAWDALQCPSPNRVQLHHPVGQ